MKKEKTKEQRARELKALATWKANFEEVHKKAVLKKFNKALEKARKEARKALEAEEGKSEALKLCIPEKNEKMGPVPSISLLPLYTCPKLCWKTCAGECYAVRNCNFRSNTMLAGAAKNTAILEEAPQLFWQQVEKFCSTAYFFRWHVAGDIPSAEYFSKMVEVAKRCPDCEFLVFTKHYFIVNSFMDKEELPLNLHIIFSGWDGIKVPNPHGLPETVVYEEEEEIQKRWLLCAGECFRCACRGLGCWKAGRGDMIALPKH